MNDIDFAAHMEAVALALLGKPNPHLSKGRNLRWGTNGSMSVDLEKGSYYSHEEKEGGGVLDLIRREKGLDAIDAIDWMNRQGIAVGNNTRPTNGAGPRRDETIGSKKEIETTFDYTDEHGQVLFQVVRWRYRKSDGAVVMGPDGKPLKTFSQRHRDPKTGEWVWNVQGIRLVPYKLPELTNAIAAPKTVLIVEGEKVVDALRQAGLQATCNPMLAGKWRTEFVPYFAGASVVILPDNDQIGQEHAQEVAASLHGTAKSVKVLTLPDLPLKGDVVDWIAAGRTVKELCELATKAPAWVPVQEAPPGPEPKAAPEADHGSAPDLSIPWPDVGAKKKPTATCANTRKAITALGIECRYDIFHDRKLVGGHVIEQYSGELSDHACLMLRVLIKARFGFDPGKEKMHDAAMQLCLQHQYDPVRDYLDSLKWEGTRRLDSWMTTYLGAAQSDLNRAIGRLALVAAVRRVRQPGCKFDQIIVLEGKEGTNKSTAIEILAGKENFSDQTIIGLDDRQQQESVAGVWLYEIADLAGMSKADVDKTKAFASRTSDRSRPAYGRHRVDQPRRCVFFATTNNDTYLKSQTGNRRFWPVQTSKIDIAALRADRDQLWAEAAHIEATEVPLVLPENLWTTAGIEQERRRDHDPWDDILENVTGTIADGVERVLTTELLRVHLGLQSDKLTDTATKRLAHVMARLGWQKVDNPMRLGSLRGRGFQRHTSGTGGLE
jgi:hypothetical protein